MCNGRHGYFIRHTPSEMPNWMSYSGEGCSLSFHIPPVFHGLVLWFHKDDKDTYDKDYCADDDLELYIHTESTLYALRYGHSFEPAPIKECGVHVIAGKSDSFEELAVGRDAMMPSPPLYHLLPHPHCGSITASTPKQWSGFLFAKLQNHNLSLTLYGKNTYFI